MQKVKKVSKMDQARKIFNSCQDKSRGNIVPKLEERLKMNKAMAGTYFQLIKTGAKKAVKKAAKKIARKPAARQAAPVVSAQPTA